MDARMACTSVLVTRNSTPLIPAWIIRLTAFPPPPPTPITLIFAVSCSSSSEIFSFPAPDDSSNVIISHLPISSSHLEILRRFAPQDDDFVVSWRRTTHAAIPPREPGRVAAVYARARDRGSPITTIPRPQRTR